MGLGSEFLEEKTALGIGHCPFYLLENIYLQLQDFLPAMCKQDCCYFIIGIIDDICHGYCYFYFLLVVAVLYSCFIGEKVKLRGVK